jgi:PAS domain-containing protein
MQDPAAEPALAPVQSAALRRGYTSVLSLPTMTNEKPCGALRLYFAERETYGPEIADLLRERLAHAMAAFARSAQRDTELRNLTDSPPQHIGLWDAKGILSYVNRAAIDYHGYAVQDLIAGAAPKFSIQTTCIAWWIAGKGPAAAAGAIRIRELMPVKIFMGARCDANATIAAKDSGVPALWAKGSFHRK